MDWGVVAVFFPVGIILGLFFACVSDLVRGKTTENLEDNSSRVRRHTNDGR